MFEFIKRLFSAPKATRMQPAHTRVAFGAGQMIAMNLLAEMESPNIIAKISYPFSRGYLFGWIDAASQCAQISLTNEEFTNFMTSGHVPIKDDVDEALTFVIASTQLQGTPDFDNGRALGALEYMKSIEGKLNMPIGLITFLNS